MNRSFYLLSIIMMVAFASCERQPEITPVYPPLVTTKGGLFILNEGNFQFGNASLDYYDFESQKISENAFESKNNRPLGDVLQSMCRYGNTGYLIVNNSQKIEVIDVNDLSSKATITGFKSPRYMVVANPQKAYVSEYYNGGIKVVDISTNTISSTIPLTGNLDEMLMLGTSLYITNANGRFMYVVSTNTDQVTDSIDVGYGSNSLRLTSDNKLWVLCSGRKDPYLNGSLTKINRDVDTVEKRFPLMRQSEHGPMKLRMNTQGTSLYWINRDVFKHGIFQENVSATPWVSSVNNNFWGINYDSLTDEVYVSDAVDFVQKSFINRYDENGGLKGTFKSGIITGDFYFYYRQ